MKRRAELPALPAGLDLLTAYGAGILARHIMAYWHARGYPGVLAERYELLSWPGVFGIKSNLLNGRPTDVGVATA